MIRFEPERTTATRSRTLLGRARALGGPRPEPVEPLVAMSAREVAYRAAARVRVLADANDTDVMLYCSCETVWIQRDGFASALDELLDNAVQATRRGYPVIVDVRDTRDGDALWQIQDSGPGIPDEVLATLGTPRPAPAPAADRAIPGVALAWAIVQRHGGLLRFESAPGVGTTASIWLPGARERRRLDDELEP